MARCEIVGRASWKVNGSCDMRAVSGDEWCCGWVFPGFCDLEVEGLDGSSLIELGFGNKGLGEWVRVGLRGRDEIFDHMKSVTSGIGIDVSVHIDFDVIRRAAGSIVYMNFILPMRWFEIFAVHKVHAPPAVWNTYFLRQKLTFERSK